MKQTLSQSQGFGQWIVGGLRGAILLGLAAGLSYAVLDLPVPYHGLYPTVHTELEASGVENPVTAVLLNFRGYDTLLEISVLTLAVVGVWSLRIMPQRRLASPGVVLNYLVRILIPFLLIFAAYLLWAGGHQAGGAFQAGAVLAAASLLFLLGALPIPPQLAGWPLRLALVLGLAVFIAVGVAMLALGRQFLDYPLAQAKYLILTIEAAATVSIGLILAAAFRGGRPPMNREE